MDHRGITLGGSGSLWDFFFFFDGSGWLLGGFLVVMVRCGNFG